MKEYLVSDLFYTGWDQLGDKTKAQVFAMHQQLLQLHPETIEYGVALIAVMRQLRKAPLLVDKVTVEQLVDIYNEVKEQFLIKPWYDFPHLRGWTSPASKMATCSFDQFIYADNEFTMYMITEDTRHLKRLVATLYLRPGDVSFDKEKVEAREKVMIQQHPLELVFYTFLHVREFVVKRCKNLLPKSAGEDNQKQTPSGPMWHEIKHAAARTLVFGSFDELGKANMYDVLDHLELLAKQNQHATA